MHKFLIALILLFVVASATAQTTTESALDSMFKQDPFFQMLDSLGKEPPRSSVDINVGVGNRLFSLNNKALTAEQANVSKLIFTPSVSYFHKSGLGFSVTGFLGSDAGKLSLFQTGLTPSYDYIGNKVTAGISYTRYLLNKSLTVSPSPFQNDLYAYVNAAKGALQPGLAIGYASGKHKEYTDTVISRPSPLPPVRIRDTTTYKIKDLSLIASVKHDFSWYNLLSNKDGLLVTPQLMLIGGSQTYSAKSTTVAVTRRRETLLRSNRLSTDQTKFTLQSAAFSLDVDYSIGQFYVRPQLYLDYYLPATTGNRLAATFNCVLGISF